MKMEKMSTDELKKLALQKDRRGCATRQALSAQAILHERAGEPFGGHEDWRDHIDDEEDITIF